MAADTGLLSWEACKPDFDGSPIYLAAVKDFLLIGTFVEVVIDDKIKVARICRSRSNDPTVASVNVFPPLFPIPVGQEQQLPISEGPGKLMVEVFQSRVCLELPVESFRRIAFVVPALGLRSSQFHWCGGMSNAYVVRFRKDPTPVSGGFDVLNDETETCFPSRHPDQRLFSNCYVERVWKGLEIVTLMLTKALNRISEKQGEYTSVTLKSPFSMPAAWAFIVESLADQVTPRDVASSRSPLSIGPGLVRRKVRILSRGTLMRFETEAELQSLRSLLGAGVTYGTRQKHPGVMAPPSVLRENDIVNVVVGSLLEATMASPFKRRTTRQGVDLVYDESGIKVVVRYQSYVYLVDADGNPRSCPCADLKRIILFCQEDIDIDGDGDNDDGDNDDDDDDLFAVGVSFAHEGYVYKITKISGERCTCICTWAPSTHQDRLATTHLFHMDDDVSTLITNYNS
jgi:hypothetical protein